jgi:arylsulfatase A-like enzyme
LAGFVAAANSAATVAVGTVPGASTATTAPAAATATAPVPALPVTATPTATLVATPTMTSVPPTPSKPSATPIPTVAATGPVEESAPPQHYVVMLVIDGGKAQYLNFSNLPNIHALMQNGMVYDQAWVGELESSTPGVHVTFGTGTEPRENGFLGFGWATPNTRRWVDFRTLLADGQIDPVLKALPVPSVADRLHQFIPGAVSIAASGHKDYATVGLGGGFADYELYGRNTGKQFMPTFMHAPPPITAGEKAALTVPAPLAPGSEDSWAFRYATTVARHVRPRLLMINLPDPDTYGHWDGPTDQPVFEKLMQGIDRGVGLIEQTYQQLGILNQTDFIITADHAMMESRGATNWKAVQSAIVASGAKVVRADGAAGGIWLQNPAQAKQAADRIVATKPQHVMAVFYRSQPGVNYSYTMASPAGWLARPQVGAALKYLVDTTAGIHGPDLWVLYRENYTVDWINVSGRWKGTHGGATWNVQHVPLVISGPDVRKGVHSDFPARAIDIAPTLERLLGLPAVKRDGVLLADALTDPMPGETAPQKAVASELGADVQMLQLQSRVDNYNTWPALPSPVYSCSKKGATCTIKPASPTNG